MSQRSFILTALAVSAVSGSAFGANPRTATPVAQPKQAVPSALLHKLQTGVNITRWFCYINEGTQDHFDHYFLPADFATLKKIHATCVRLCVSPDVILRDGKVRGDALAAIDVAIAKLNLNGQAVIWDLHDNGQMKLDAPGNDNSVFINLWTQMARHYKGKRELDLLFELVNEPQFGSNPDVWFDLQEKTVSAIRAVDSARTIMVSSNGYSGIDNLHLLKPLAATNLVYTFHCYDPFFFTHQGATWAGDDVKPLKHVPFPGTQAAVDAMLDELPDAHSKDLIRDFAKQNYNAAYLLGRLKTAADWGQAHHLPMFMGEFGAYPVNSLPADRGRWFAGIRAAIDALKMPNCLWGYDDGFGIGREVNPDGTLKLDPIGMSFYK